MKSYNLPQLKKDLLELNGKMVNRHITKVAAVEHIDPSTVRAYLSGKVSTPAIAEAIVKSSKQVLADEQAIG